MLLEYILLAVITALAILVLRNHLKHVKKIDEKQEKENEPGVYVREKGFYVVDGKKIKHEVMDLSGIDWDINDF